MDELLAPTIWCVVAMYTDGSRPQVIGSVYYTIQTARDLAQYMQLGDPNKIFAEYTVYEYAPLPF